MLRMEIVGPVLCTGPFNAACRWQNRASLSASFAMEMTGAICLHSDRYLVILGAYSPSEPHISSTFFLVDSSILIGVPHSR